MAESVAVICSLRINRRAAARCRGRSQTCPYEAIPPGHEVSGLQMALAQASVAPFMGRSLVAWRFIAGRCISLLS